MFYKRFFWNYCDIGIKNPKLRQKLIEKVGNDIMSGELYDLVVTAIEKAKVFTVRDGDIIYQLYALSNKIRENDTVYIDMEECGNILRKKYQLDNEDDIIVFKIEYLSPEFKIPIVEYNFFGQFGTKKLSISTCNDMKFTYYIPKEINDFEDYKYNPENEYYHDSCYRFTSSNKTDIILKDRMDEFNKNNMSLCESMCKFKGYRYGTIECECKNKIKFNSYLNFNASKSNLIYKFEISKKIFSNFWVFKCYPLIFSKEVIISNFCSTIILGILGFTLIGALIFRIKGYKNLYNKIKILIPISLRKNNYNIQKQTKKKFPHIINNTNNINTNKKRSLLNSNNFHFNKDKNEQSSNRGLNLIPNIDNRNNKIRTIIKNRSNINIVNKFKKKNNNIVIDEETKKLSEITDNELNSLSYYDAIIKDKRTFGQFYLSLIKTKQLLAFTFKGKNDFNSRIMKLNFLFLMFSITFFINTTFFDDIVLHDIFISGGKLNIMYFIPIIAYVTIITSVIKNILMELIFTEGDAISIKVADPLRKNDTIKSAVTAITLKSILFYFCSIVFISFTWVYIACFFSVFRNSQLYVIKNTAISFAMILLVPFVFYLIPAAFRIISLDSREKKNRLCLYIFSKILQILF